MHEWTHAFLKAKGITARPAVFMHDLQWIAVTAGDLFCSCGWFRRAIWLSGVAASVLREADSCQALFSSMDGVRGVL